MQVGNFTVQTFEIEGLLLITPKCFGDDRGFFTERFRSDEFAKMGLPSFIQDNYSRSQQGVLRGLHFQFDKPLSKLVTASRGRIVDVAVDVRKDSATFGKHQKVILDSAQPQWLWLPPGFAHGFYVVSEEGADVMYKVDQLHSPQGEGAIRWNDPALGIDWFSNSKASGEPILSNKDLVAPMFSEYKLAPRF